MNMKEGGKLPSKIALIGQIISTAAWFGFNPATAENLIPLIPTHCEPPEVPETRKLIRLFDLTQGTCFTHALCMLHNSFFWASLSNVMLT